MINDGREFLIKRRRGNSAKCSAFSLWRSQSENRVPRGCSGSRRCFLFTAVPGGPHRRRGSSRIRSVMSAVRSTYGTVRIKLLVFSKTARGGRGGDARTGPCTPAHVLCSRHGRAAHLPLLVSPGQMGRRATPHLT